MRILFIIITLTILSCKNEQKTETKTEQSRPATTATATVEKKQPEKKIVEEEPLVADTGQTWFKVSVTRNDTPYIKYEGTWPVLLTTTNFATLALTASKGALVISHGVTFYMYGWPPVIGRIPVMSGAGKNREISMIMVPEINGAYGLAISPDTGFVEITKNENNGKLISAYFQAQATNEKKDKFHFKGQFLNVKPH